MSRVRQAERLIRSHAMAGLGAGLVPVPGWDLAALAATRVSMVRALARLYDLHEGRRGLAVGGVVATTLPLHLAVPWAASLLKTVPVLGTGAGAAVMPLLGGGGTYAIGRLVMRHFESGGGLHDFDPKRDRDLLHREYQRGLRVLRRARLRPRRDND